nr:cupin domain-containing protein [Veillonella denticariosi]
MSKTFTKNIPVNEILHLADVLEYKAGQVISITIAQNERLSITLFALPKGGEEISTHITVGGMPLCKSLMEKHISLSAIRNTP